MLAEGADVELRTRFDVYEDRQNRELFGRGERSECYAINEVGCPATLPVDFWIKDDFLVDGRTIGDEQALLEMICNRVARHFDLDDRGVGAVIQAKLEAQYMLGHAHAPGAPLLMVEVYRDLSTAKLFATAERKRLCKVRRFACGMPQNTLLWVRDHALSDLISDIASATSDLFIAEVQDRIGDCMHLGDDMTLSKRDHRYLLAPFELEEAGIEDDFEQREVWIDVVSDPRSGKVWLTAQASGLVELQPVDWEDVAHEDVLVEDTVTNAVIKHVTGASAEALVEAGARTMARRFSTAGYLLDATGDGQG